MKRIYSQTLSENNAPMQPEVQPEQELPKGYSSPQDYEEDMEWWHDNLAKGMIQRVNKEKPIDLSEYVADPKKYFSTVHPIENYNQIDPQRFQKHFAFHADQVYWMVKLEISPDSRNHLVGFTTYGYEPDGSLTHDDYLDFTEVYLENGFEGEPDKGLHAELQNKFKGKIASLIKQWIEGAAGRGNINAPDGVFVIDVNTHSTTRGIDNSYLTYGH